MHVLGNDRVAGLHPQLSRARDTSASELHEEEAVRVTASTDRVQGKVEIARSVGIQRARKRLIALDTHQAQSPRGQTQSVVSLESRLVPQASGLDAYLPYVI